MFSGDLAMYARTVSFDHGGGNCGRKEAPYEIVKRNRYNLVKTEHGSRIVADRWIEKNLGYFERVSSYPSTVLITGETGTGKEAIAKLLHYMGRGRHPFVGVNLGALNPGLFESELFGYKKGAFTGAYRNKKGLFDVAGNGTIFLDEIGELPLHLQQKLLRALDEREYYPLGGTKPLNLKARVICATNKNPEELMESGEMLPDLYYRINVVRIDIPPLRKRSKMIKPLLYYFFDELAKRWSREGFKLIEPEEFSRRIEDPVVREFLHAHEWPGNIRELRNFAENAIIGFREAYNYINNIKPCGDGYFGCGLKERVRKFKEQYVKRVVESCGYDVKEAAGILKITPSSVYRIMQESENPVSEKMLGRFVPRSRCKKTSNGIRIAA